MRTRILLQFLLILSIVPISHLRGQVKMAIPHPVQIYRGSGITSLVYELHLLDSLKRPVEFIEFTIKSDNVILLQDSICERLPKKSDRNRYVKYVWINIDQIPKILSHHIKYKVDEKTYDFSKEVEVIEEPVISIGLPVKNGIWYLWQLS